MSQPSRVDLMIEWWKDGVPAFSRLDRCYLHMTNQAHQVSWPCIGNRRILNNPHTIQLVCGSCDLYVRKSVSLHPITVCKDAIKSYTNSLCQRMDSQFFMNMTLTSIASLQKSLQCLPRARASNRDICTDWVRLYHEVLYDTLSYKTSWCTLQKYCSIHSPKVLYGTVSYSTLCYTLTLHCMAQSHIVLWYCLIQYFMIHSQKVLYDTVSNSDVWYSLTKYCMV